MQFHDVSVRIYENLSNAARKEGIYPKITALAGRFHFITVKEVEMNTNKIIELKNISMEFNGEHRALTENYGIHGTAMYYFVEPADSGKYAHHLAEWIFFCNFAGSL